MWNERFAGPGFLFGTEPARFLLDHQDRLKPGASALAVADGEGRNSVYMAKRGLRVTAFDSSDVAVNKARGLAATNNVDVNYQVADIDGWSWKEAAHELVVAIFIQFAGPDFRDSIFAGIKKTLKPGGVLLLHGYTPKQIAFGTGGPGIVENLYTLEMLNSAFADMDILHVDAYEREINEGEGHCGMSALIDMVARKR